MKNVKASIAFSLQNEDGEEMHTSIFEFSGLDEEQVLVIEGHMIGMLSAMHKESSDFVQAAKGKK